MLCVAHVIYLLVGFPQITNVTRDDLPNWTVANPQRQTHSPSETYLTLSKGLMRGATGGPFCFVTYGAFHVKWTDEKNPTISDFIYT
jgi:hypothetical protein